MGLIGLGLGSGPHVMGRLGSGLRVNASFQLRYIALYRLAHGGGGRGTCPTPHKNGGGMSGRGKVLHSSRMLDGVRKRL